MTTEQERLWKGQFGDDYNLRNVGKVEANIAFFAKALARTSNIRRIIELGAGIGQNIIALHRLLPNADLMGVEINEEAALQIQVGYVFRASIFDFEPPAQTPVDLAFTKGLLIHIHPDDIERAYDKLYACSSRYVLIAEYFSPNSEEIMYRGNMNALWKRDFAGEMMQQYPDLHLLDYGFQSRLDPNWPQDDLNWFLMEKY